MKKILILEDAHIGRQLLQHIVDRGLSGNCYIGVRSVKDGQLTGIRHDFSDETVDLSQFGIAFVDGFLYIDGLMGWDLLPLLSPLMYTVGTSSVGDIGANKSIEKADMISLFDQLLLDAGL